MSYSKPVVVDGEREMETLIGLATLIAALTLGAAPIVLIGYFAWRRKQRNAPRGH